MVSRNGWARIAVSLASSAAFAQRWQAATPLDTGGSWSCPQASPQAGIDGVGNARAVWQDVGGPVSFSVHAPGGFRAAQTLLAGSCTSSCATPEPASLAVNATGNAVAVFQQPVTVGPGWKLFATTTN